MEEAPTHRVSKEFTLAQEFPQKTVSLLDRLTQGVSEALFTNLCDFQCQRKQLNLFDIVNLLP